MSPAWPSETEDRNNPANHYQVLNSEYILSIRSLVWKQWILHISIICFTCCYEKTVVSDTNAISALLLIIDTDVCIGWAPLSYLRIPTK